MPSSVELVCVDPARVADFWPLARSHIRTAIERTDLSEFADIERDVLAGDQLLWLAWSGTLEAAATTHLIKTRGRPVLIVTACSGQQRERWLPLFAKIEEYARAEGARCVRIYGRRGWERALSGYRLEHVILEKELN
jgi:hypothetical protein